jgi:sensor histidine kinase regulating citrate/malate metabolism
VTIAAATLPWRHAWLIAAASMAAYTFLMVVYQPVPQLGQGNGETSLGLHVLGMWINFGLSAGLVTFFIYKMAHALRSRDQALSRAREAALTNLLNNAADANPDDITIRLDWNGEEVIIDIRDHGPGVAMSIADQLGETFVSTKSKGLGIGLFLTHATINRFGGEVRLYNHPEGGTLTEVTLPRNQPAT